MHTVYLGLGANLGNRIENLRAGLRLLASDLHLSSVSPLYESEPIGYTNQDPFLNAACAAETQLSPWDLLTRAKAVEAQLGRQNGPRWGPRPLDLDILLYDESLVGSPDLQIPHPRLAEREFVLRPLADLAPALVVPGDGRTIAQLLKLLPPQGVRLVEPAGWDGEQQDL